MQYRKCTGYTLLELLTVVAIMATLGGVVVMALSRVEKDSFDDISRSELTQIRQAVLQFKSDMGEPPQLIAELLQSPDPTDPMGGWWWRIDDPADRFAAPVGSKLFSYDPATRRGWDGPYLRVEFRSTPAVAAQEIRIHADGNADTIGSNATRQIVLLLSHGEATDLGPVVSDFQLDFSNPAELVVRFLGTQSRPKQQPQELGMGIEP